MDRRGVINYIGSAHYDLPAKSDPAQYLHFSHNLQIAEKKQNS